MEATEISILRRIKNREKSENTRKGKERGVDDINGKVREHVER